MLGYGGIAWVEAERKAFTFHDRLFTQAFSFQTRLLATSGQKANLKSCCVYLALAFDQKANLECEDESGFMLTRANLNDV